MFVQILWKSVTFKLPKKKRTIDSPVLTYLSNSVLAGSRVKEIWATLLYYDCDSGHQSIPKIN